MKDQNCSIQKMLKDCILFRDADKEVIELIAESMKPIKLSEGQPVFLENEPSENIYFVQSGSVEIVVNTSKEKAFKRVRMAKTGEHFSEFSVLTHSKHSTSAFALEETELLCLDGATFMQLMVENNFLTLSLLNSLARQIHANLSDSYSIRPFPIEHAEFDPAMVKFFSANYIKKYNALPLKFENGKLHIGLVLPIQQQFFQEFEKDGINCDIQLSSIKEEDYQNIKNDVLNCYLGRAKCFESINRPKKQDVAPPNVSKEEELKEFFSFCLLFSQFDEASLNNILPFCEIKHFKKDEIIFKEGSPCEYQYLVKNGEVSLTKKIQDHPLVCLVENLKSFDSVGESNIICNSWHSLTATATTDCSVITIRREAVEKLIHFTEYSLPLAIQISRRLQALNHLPGIELNFNEESPITSITEITAFRTLENGYEHDRINLEEASGVESLFKEILKYCAEHRTSDIHMEHLSDRFVVRSRIDGVLCQLFESLPTELGNELISHIKVVSKMKITERRLPQDGGFHIEEKTDEGEESYGGRVSTIPARYGEKLVIRLLRKQSAIIPLNKVAHDRRVYQFLNSIKHFRQGLFLISGPTGSGKTTTLYSILDSLNRAKKNIMTLEDPIELDLQGVNQTSINNEIGLTYNVMLKHALRQDPDVILVGEIRDAESLKLVFDASLTGHLVLATVHASSSIDVFPRLIELGANPAQISSSLIGVLAQRLVRAICTDCKSYKTISSDEVSLFRTVLPDHKISTQIAYGKGCNQCNYTGFLNRIPIFEFWQKNDEVAAQLLGEEGIKEISTVLRNSENFENLAQYGYKVAAQGLTTLEEVGSHIFGVAQVPKKGKKDDDVA